MILFLKKKKNFKKIKIKFILYKKIKNIFFKIFQKNKKIIFLRNIKTKIPFLKIIFLFLEKVPP